MSDREKQELEEAGVSASVRLALAWASLMFLYSYNDYFSMYSPGTIGSMAKGQFGPLGEATAAVLAAVSIMLAIPALMIFLSVSLPAVASRGLNVAFGAAYTIIEILTFFGAPLFYRIVVCLEVALSAFIVWHALTWPRRRPPG